MLSAIDSHIAIARAAAKGEDEAEEEGRMSRRTLAAATATRRPG